MELVDRKTTYSKSNTGFEIHQMSSGNEIRGHKRLSLLICHFTATPAVEMLRL
jgi:hypothetical protein